MSEHSPLYWFPFDVDAWLTSAAVAAMVPEQEGAYLRLLLVSWGDGNAEPSLPTDQAQLAQLSRLGPRWRKLGHLIVEQFEERNGRLVNAKLAAVWWEQQEKHATAVIKAGKGGRGRAAKLREARSKDASSTPQADLELAPSVQKENGDGVVTPAPTGAGGNQSPATGDAPAPVGAARAAATSGNGRPTGPATLRYLEAPSIADQQEARDDRERRYFALLTREADAWMALNRETTKQIGREQRPLLGLPAGELSPGQQRVLRDAVVEAIRERLCWPTTEEWDESDALITQTPTGATP